MAQVNPCVQNCPQRSVLCHAGCEAYNEYHKQREAEMKRRAQKADEAGFYHEARQAVKKNMKGRSDMTTDELIEALERMESETGSLEDSLCCLGCGHEHNCGVHGCAVIREAIKTAKLYQAAYKVLERQRDCDTCLYNNPCGMDDLRCTVCTRGQKWRWDRGGVE